MMCWGGVVVVVLGCGLCAVFCADLILFFDAVALLCVAVVAVEAVMSLLF